MSKKVHILTDPEKMIWAAVYAREFDLSEPPSRCLIGADKDTGKEWAEWEAEKCRQAAEVASAAVMNLREQRESIVEDWEGLPTATFVNQIAVWI